MLHVDGSDETGTYRGDGCLAPFAVFDDESQEWLVMGLRWRWQASLILAWAAMTRTDRMFLVAGLFAAAAYVAFLVKWGGLL